MHGLHQQFLPLRRRCSLRQILHRSRNQVRCPRIRRTNPRRLHQKHRVNLLAEWNRARPNHPEHQRLHPDHRIPRGSFEYHKPDRKLQALLACWGSRWSEGVCDRQVLWSRVSEKASFAGDPVFRAGFDDGGSEVFGGFQEIGRAEFAGFSRFLRVFFNVFQGRFETCLWVFWDFYTNSGLPALEGGIISLQIERSDPDLFFIIGGFWLTLEKASELAILDFK